MNSLVSAVENSKFQNLFLDFVETISQGFFIEFAKKYFYTLFFKEPPRKYLNFTIKENMRGKRVKDETFRNVIIWSLVILSSS